MCPKKLSNRAPIWLAVLATTLVLAANEFVPNDQPYGYQAPVALSKTDVKDGTAVAFVPWFEATNFTGELLAAPVSVDGIVDHFGPTWRASETVDAMNWDLDRRIFTRNDSTGLAVPFRYANLSNDQKKDLNESEALTNYIRGDRSGETAGGFRERTRLLGDIIHSNPVYVGKPLRGYLFDNYLQFAAANRSRPGRVYVGANDGMLHAFNAATGNEEFAYIPSMLIPKLPALSEAPLVHNYLVDGPMVAEDVYFGGAWHTVLVGGLGAGGKGLFALDVTSATVASETDAAGRLLWEFTDQDTDILGHTYSRPSIVRLNNGSWAAVIGNGYMGKGKAALLVIDISNGSLIRKIEVDDSDKNGLSSPALIDVDGDFVADIAYAGDLNGNLWKFDLSDPDPSNWVPAWDKKPLFITENDSGIGRRQPITTAPTVGVHPEGGYFVYVGTGGLLAEQDAVEKYALAPQSFYGIWDNSPDAADVPYETTDLLQQNLLVKTHPDDSETVRTATANVPDWTTHRGWATRLDASGAVLGTRVITDHSLRNDRVHFTSIDPTTGSGNNYLMQLNAYTGGAPSATVIDVNGNGSIEIADNTDGDGNGTVENTAADRVVGQYLSYGTASAPMLAALGANDAAIVNKLYTVVSSENPFVDPPEGGEDAGLIGGHIDVDTAHEIYDFDDGTTDEHVHEWDDKYDSIFVDFFDIYGDGFADIDEPGMQPATGDKTFILTVANAHLSPGAVIEINGAAQPVKEYRAKVKRFLAGNLGAAETFPRYKLTDPSELEALAGIVKLTDFRMSFAKDGLLLGGVHPTNTGCVRGNEPGQDGEYRNGALTIQAIDATSVVGGHVFNPANSAYETVSHAIHSLGYAVSRDPVNADDGSLFWETTIFWHWGGDCYGIDDKETYDAQFAEEVTDIPRGTDDDITGDPLPEPEPEPEDPPEEEEAPPTSSVSTTEIAGGAAGRLSWRELMIDE